MADVVGRAVVAATIVHDLVVREQSGGLLWPIAFLDPFLSRQPIAILRALQWPWGSGPDWDEHMLGLLPKTSLLQASGRGGDIQTADDVCTMVALPECE